MKAEQCSYLLFRSESGHAYAPGWGAVRGGRAREGGPPPCTWPPVGRRAPIARLALEDKPPEGSLLHSLEHRIRLGAGLQLQVGWPTGGVGESAQPAQRMGGRIRQGPGQWRAGPCSGVQHAQVNAAAPLGRHGSPSVPAWPPCHAEAAAGRRPQGHSHTAAAGRAAAAGGDTAAAAVVGKGTLGRLQGGQGRGKAMGGANLRGVLGASWRAAGRRERRPQCSARRRTRLQALVTWRVASCRVGGARRVASGRHFCGRRTGRQSVLWGRTGLLDVQAN